MWTDVHEDLEELEKTDALNHEYVLSVFSSHLPSVTSQHRDVDVCHRLLKEKKSEIEIMLRVHGR